MRLILRPGALLMLAVLATAAAAQDFGAAFADFSAGSGEAIQIEADRLEIRDEEKVAVYLGNVRVRQGATVLETSELRVHYAGAVGEGGVPGSAVTRIEAGPGVFVRSGDQTASGDSAVLDMATDVVTLSGNVLVAQGRNIVRGDRLVVNLNTKQGRMEGGRVQTLITPPGASP